MAKKKTPKKADETHKGGELPAVTLAPEPSPEPELKEAAEVVGASLAASMKSAEDVGGLLELLPPPAFQRITALSVGQSYIATTERGAWAFVRATGFLYGSGFLGKREAVTAEELREIVAACKQDGEAAGVFTMGDFLKELRRRSGGLN